MAEEVLGSTVFSSLAKPVREVLRDLGFREPTLPQELAISPILAGENVLLIAPTGSGKTEAVLLPIFSKLIQQEDKHGISLIYITPLRALNRDMLKRLSLWSSRLNISIEVRHGDTDLKLRRKQAIFPPQMLVTTPETLQAILPGTRMRQHLGHVQFVVVDEVHELASSKRGTQLTVALERLGQITEKESQRIGLSATVGNPDEVAHFIAGTGRTVRVVQAMPAKDYSYRAENPEPIDSDYDLAAKLKTAPEAAARLRRIMELVDSHKSTLIFVNSRQNAEMLGHRFDQLSRTDIAVHHGSLSKEVRAHIEDEFKEGTLKAIICTSTLELGIDIGNVDLVIQYLSPRQVSSLIQRVGRSGHSLDRLSRGVIMTAFSDDTLESSAAIKNAYEGKIEPVLIHENALDVLGHQIVGILLDLGSADRSAVLDLVRRAYPYRNIEEESFQDVIQFLETLGEVRTEGGKMLRKTGKGRRYYYENLSMIPDERRYPIINVISDRKIGTLGDEFMAFDARIGLNIIVHGKVWRIIQIEEETGTVYVVPSEDPFAAIPGWDGEMIPVPFELAQKTGELRSKILEALKTTGSAEAAADKLSKELSTEKSALLDSVKEIQEHMKQGAPLPTDDHVVIEAFDKYLIVHACFGEMVNRTFGSVFDAVLSNRELIVGWWTDGYRILIETPRKLSKQEIETMRTILFNLSDQEIDDAFSHYVKSKFPFGAKMKFVAQRFGALPRGKTIAEGRLAQLAGQFEGTPIYDETLREAMLDKVDIKRVKSIMRSIREGRMRVSTVFRPEKPTPLAYHALTQYSDVSELMAPEEVLTNNIDRMKKALDARTARLLCVRCGEWTQETVVRKLNEHPSCGKCGSNLVALLHFGQDAVHLQELLRKRRLGEDLLPEEVKELSHTRRTADLILSYGKQAITALEVKGVGPETASRILGKMHHKEDEFYMDLLKAKIQYLKTRAFWDDKDKRDF
jgi:ATP-dependent Lhr-like helicase